MNRPLTIIELSDIDFNDIKTLFNNASFFGETKDGLIVKISSKLVLIANNRYQPTSIGVIPVRNINEAKKEAEKITLQNS